jgi:hypothetical protein
VKPRELVVMRPKELVVKQRKDEDGSWRHWSVNEKRLREND